MFLISCSCCFLTARKLNNRKEFRRYSSILCSPTRSPDLVVNRSLIHAVPSPTSQWLIALSVYDKITKEAMSDPRLFLDSFRCYLESLLFHVRARSLTDCPPVQIESLCGSLLAYVDLSRQIQVSE